MIGITECPRDAMQGFEKMISTETKIEYLNLLLKVGFTILDCGSFVSPKAIPQLADTSDVLQAIDTTNSKSKLLVIVANERGAENAVKQDKIQILGFPFSISEQFQLRNTKQTIQKALIRLQNIQNIADDGKKEVLAYLSMGFGNPYGDEYSVQIAYDWCSRLSDLGIQQINLSDTIGKAHTDDIKNLFEICQSKLPHIRFGAHFHTHPGNEYRNLKAAYDAGCQNFDSAMKGFGGCPFADDHLTGNLPTENLIQFLNNEGENIDFIQNQEFQSALSLAAKVFS